MLGTTSHHGNLLGKRFNTEQRYAKPDRLGRRQQKKAKKFVQKGGRLMGLLQHNPNFHRKVAKGVTFEKSEKKKGRPRRGEATSLGRRQPSLPGRRKVDKGVKKAKIRKTEDCAKETRSLFPERRRAPHSVQKNNPGKSVIGAGKLLNEKNDVKGNYVGTPQPTTISLNKQ